MKKAGFLLAVYILGMLMATTVFGAEKSHLLAQRYGVNGYSIAYSENSEIRFENYGNGISEKSVYELASNGKVVSAYIALKLVDQGKLSLDGSIVPYLESKLLTDDTRMNDITVRNLLCHTAGFSPSFEFGLDKKIYSDPGAEFRYSGVGYIYLQSIIESSSGMTLEQAANHYVFEPLGMNNSTFESTKTVTPYMNLSSAMLYALVVFILVFAILLLVSFVIGKITKFKFYSFKTGMLVCISVAGIANILFLIFSPLSKVVVVFLLYLAVIGLTLLFTRKNAKLFYTGMPILTALILTLGFTIQTSIPVTNNLIANEPNCAYTLKSTSEDMAIFCEELTLHYNSENGAVREMFAHAVNIDDVNSWGLGIAIEATENGDTYWHSGINPGFQSLIVLYPQQNKYVVVLTNSDNGLAFSKDIAETFLAVDGSWDIKR